jgi:hypothetical protein
MTERKAKTTAKAKTIAKGKPVAIAAVAKSPGLCGALEV